jgi:uncharacterized protein (TIGR00255 family)
MIKSMTGFGKSVCELPDKLVTIEIKTLNSKQLDLHLRLPPIYKEKEPDIRQLVSQSLERGKIECTINIENIGPGSNYSFNHQLAETYYKELKQMAGNLGEEHQEFLPIIVRLPDVLAAETLELDKKEWEQVLEGISTAIIQVNEFRAKEGKILEEDFLKHTKLLESSSKKIQPFEEKRQEHMRDKIRKALSELAEEGNVDENRFEQELIYYLEKFDITEEKVRLQQHIDYFLQTMSEKISNGKKLNFIAQEIGREVNTIGSKANDADIQKIVVIMKDELEKIKEQLHNIL